MSRADMQLLGRDLTSLSVALATGGIGSVELVGQVLAAVEASQAPLNAYISVDAEGALRAANDKFARRFTGIEDRVGGNLTGLSLDALEAHWQAVKASERS